MERPREVFILFIKVLNDKNIIIAIILIITKSVD
ncbi:hypothetical protein F0Z19_0535 [Vibrio cyclitrophicus]|nr:hypothetical protein F0Z19_0535 [Vibrio cyclitrophicus]